MKAKAMELAGSDAADAAGDFVAQRDGGDQIFSGDGPAQA
jgi:hypothetical protein